jgi:hypothetical protein
VQPASVGFTLCCTEIPATPVRSTQQRVIGKQRVNHSFCVALFSYEFERAHSNSFGLARTSAHDAVNLGQISLRPLVLRAGIRAAKPRFPVDKRCVVYRGADLALRHSTRDVFGCTSE